jgi:catecholate siderophore receptor
VGAGAQYVSDRLAQNFNPLEVAPSYWTVDLMAKYQISPHFTLQANLNNVGDTYYYDLLHPFHVVPGAGRTALISITARY